ncbi:MAG: hypothetical protein HXY22_04580 [Alphaproteobacteria bacterium]|nr:hypothetical protein [Alphaproteobacteria bacterium]
MQSILKIAVLIIFASVAAASSADACPLAGRYNVEGTNVGGQGRYKGEAVISANGEKCVVNWLPPNTSAGEGTFDGETLTVRFSGAGARGTVVYTLQTDGSLDGRWWLDQDEGRVGRERLTPMGKSSGAGGPTGPAAAEGQVLGGGQTLVVQMSGIDDIGLAGVASERRSFRILGGAEWSAQNQNASARIDLTSQLDPGRNVLVLLLHDKRFVFGGKWAYRFALKADGETIWSDRNAGSTRGAGIRYWAAFEITRDASGRLSVSTASSATLAGLNPTIDDLNARLIANFGEETSVMGALAGALVEGMAVDMLGGGGTSPQQRCPNTVWWECY